MAKGKRRGFFKLKGAGNKGRGGLGGGLGVAAACENNGVFALKFKLGGAYVGDGRGIRRGNVCEIYDPVKGGIIGIKNRL